MTFLEHVPGNDLVARLNEVAFPPDDYRVRGREIFVRHMNGVSGSTINLARIARVLEIGHMTSRNWRIVTTLADMARDRA